MGVRVREDEGRVTSKGEGGLGVTSKGEEGKRRGESEGGFV